MQHALHLAELSAPTRAHRLNTQQLHRSRHCSMPAGTPSSSSAEVGTVACWQAARAPRSTAAAPHAAALPAALFAKGCRAEHLTRRQQHPLACSCWMPQQPRIKSCDQMDSRGWCSGTSRRQVSPPEAARHTGRPQYMSHCRSGSRWWSPAWRPLPLPGWHQRPASLTRRACPKLWPGVAPTQQTFCEKGCKAPAGTMWGRQLCQGSMSTVLANTFLLEGLQPHLYADSIETSQCQRLSVLSQQ